MPVSALGFEGSRAALAARGVRLPADRGEGCGEQGEREGRHGEAPLGAASAGAEVAVVGSGWVAYPWRLGGCLAEVGNGSDALRVGSSFLRPVAHALLLWQHYPSQRAEGVEAELWPSLVSH